MEDDTCYFVAVDFDDADWREDSRAFMQSCEELGVPAALEISRSGQGAHAWIFFEGLVLARDARRLGTAIITHTCARMRQLQLESYDRLFPNQDTLPKGGFGNLIALPLQKTPRENNCSVFVDNQLTPYTDQWAFLASIQPMAMHDIEPTIFRATEGNHPLDVTFIEEEDLATPWKRSQQNTARLSGPMPARLNVTLANCIYCEKVQLPHSLANRLIRFAAFQNPEFYKAQAMRLSVWDRHLANDPQRTSNIGAAIQVAYREGRKILVLTERAEHLDAIAAAIEETPFFVLHGRLSKKHRASVIEQLNALPSDTPRILLATGKLVGEGFNHPPLDTLVLAMPVSWRGTLQQYAGRLHREQAGKVSVRIIDIVDTGHPALLRMWEKRQRGYRAMGYRVISETTA